MLLGVMVCLTVSTMFTSCKKTESEIGNAQALSAISAQLNFRNFPKVENGMLVFQDTAHFSSYLTFLEDAIKNEKDSTLEDDNIYQNIENAIGFSSLRKTALNQFLQLEQAGFASLDAIPDEHFIQSRDIRSILNNNLEVRIGGELIHYVNANFAVSIDATKTDIIDQFRALPATATLEDILTINPNRKFVSVYDLTREYTITGGGRGTGTVLGVPHISLPNYRPVDGCNNPTLIEFRDLGFVGGGSNYQQAYYKVFFGDGTSQEYNYGNNPAYFVTPFTHQYPNMQQRTVTVYAYSYQGGPLLDTKSFTVTPTQTSCARKNKYSGWQYTQISSTDYIGGKVYIEDVTPFWSYERTRVKAESKLVRQNSSNNYDGFKGHMYTVFSTYTKDNNCNNMAFLIEDVGDTKKKSHSVEKDATGIFYWSTVTSQHSHTRNGVTYTVNINLQACN